ncbi:MAG: helix-turn-helix domain-containing protein [Pseudomonadota bacterium]
MALTLKHRDILRNGAKVHLTRALLQARRPKVLHGHDFYELVWVQNGRVRHHLPTGPRDLTEGDAAFLRPGQTHGLQGRGDDALVVSVSMHPDVISTMPERHPRLAGHLFWTDGPPEHAHRDIRQLAALNQAAVALEKSKHDTLSTEAFLLPLCAELIVEAFPPSVPKWLAAACLAAHDPAVFREGSAGLVAYTGKAHAHVSRSMRKYLGVTPSAYVNDLRAAFAARALATDTIPVNVVAQEVGVPNMSHFHKLFRAAYGMTPLQYRQHFQREIVQPTRDVRSQSN